MSTIIPSRVRPEDEELAKKLGELAELESDLADRELHIATLRSELASFEKQYLKIVGTKYAELDEVNARIAEQIARQHVGDRQREGAAQQARKQRQRLMAEANRAYEMGDIARLKQILEEYDTCPEAVQGEGVGAELIRVIRKINQVKRRLTEIVYELNLLVDSDLAKLRAKAEEYDKLGRDLLAEMAKQIDLQILAARQQG